MPLGPAIRLELARQLEVIVADALDSALPVAPFLRGLRAQLECSTSVHECSAHEGAPPYGRSQAQNAAADATWPALEQHRPAGIVRSEWEGLFEYVIVLGCVLIMQGGRGFGMEAQPELYVAGGAAVLCLLVSEAAAPKPAPKKKKRR